MKSIQVAVEFRGSVSVNVPDHLPPRDASLLARKVALAQVLATIENPDNGEVLECALEEYQNEASEDSQASAENDFDATECESVGGSWGVVEPIV